MKNSKEIFHRLLSLPIFSGLSYEDIIAIAGRTRLDFHEVAAGHVIAAEGAPSDHVVFVMSGIVTSTVHSADKAYSVTEYVPSPFAFQPETVFGSRQYFGATITAVTECSYLVVSKRDIIHIGDMSEVFKYNMIGFISTCVQSLYRRLWHVPPRSAADAIAFFVQDRCLRPAGRKVLRIKLRRLATEVGQSYLAVARAVADMQQRGLLYHSRGEIEIPALEDMIRAVRVGRNPQSPL